MNALIVPRNCSIRQAELGASEGRLHLLEGLTLDFAQSTPKFVREFAIYEIISHSRLQFLLFLLFNLTFHRQAYSSIFEICGAVLLLFFCFSVHQILCENKTICSTIRFFLSTNLCALLERVLSIKRT